MRQAIQGGPHEIEWQDPSANYGCDAALLTNQLVKEVQLVLPSSKTLKITENK